MTGELALATIAAIGGAGGLVALFQFFNTRKSTADKSSHDAYGSYRSFVTGATDDWDRELDRVKTDRDVLWGIRETLIDLVQDLFTLCRNVGVPAHTLDKFQDRLDAVRRI